MVSGSQTRDHRLDDAGATLRRRFTRSRRRESPTDLRGGPDLSLARGRDEPRSSQGAHDLHEVRLVALRVNAEVPLPSETTDLEAELVVVLGTTVRHLSVA